MIPVLQALPIDWSSKSPNNRTKGELHDLSPQFDLPYRIVVMAKGYFYTNDLFIMDNRGYVLKEDLDYQCILMNKEIAKDRGLTACAVILVTNPRVGNYLRIDAQMVGGRFCSLNTAILEQAANVIRNTNDRVYWKNLKDKPNTFRPNGHLHALWELFGFSEQTAIIKRMSTAMDKTLGKAFDDLFDEYMNKLNGPRQDLIAVEQQLTAHIADQLNPHNLTIQQVQLENVRNGAPATLGQAQSASGSIMDAYATPLRAKQSIESNFLPALQAHIQDYNNPHGDTAASLGTYTVQELQSLANQYYNVGETVNITRGLGGYDYNGYKVYAQANIPVVNLVRGIATWPLITPPDQAPTPNSVAAPGWNGYIHWQPISLMIELFGKKGNKIVYTGLKVGNTTNSALDVNFVVNRDVGGTLGYNYPIGTIAVFQHEWWFVGKAGGYLNTIVHNFGMATFDGTRWVVPGWPVR